MPLSPADEEQLRSTLRLILQLKETNQDLRILAGKATGDTLGIAAVFHCYEIYQQISILIEDGPKARKFLCRIEANEERTRFGTLFNLGIQKLLAECEQTIMKNTIWMDPEPLLDLCRSSTTDSAYPNAIEDTELGIFRIIFDWFYDHGFPQGLLDMYAAARGAMIHDSLKKLADYLSHKPVRRASFSVLNITPGLLSPRLSRSPFSAETLRLQVKSTVYRAGRRFSHSPVFGRRDRSASRDGTLLAPRVDTPPDDPDNNEVSLTELFNDEREASNYKFLLDALIILLLRESELIVRLFPTEFRPTLLVKMIGPSMAYLQEMAERLCAAVTDLPDKIHTGKHAIHGTISIIRWFYKPKPNLTELNEESELTLQQKFDNSLLSVFECAAMKYLQAVLAELQTQSITFSPDGQIHPLAIHVLDFIAEFLDCEHIIAKTQERSNSSPSAAGNECLDLDSYVAHLYQSLCMHIFENTAPSVKQDESVPWAIFLLNNASFLLNRIESSFLLATMQKVQPNFKSHLQSYIEQGIRIYARCCAPMVTAMHQMFQYADSRRLSASQVSNSIAQPSIRENDRERLKAGFSSVNSAIDAFCRQTQHVVVDDGQLRDQLRAESKALVLDKYKCFFTQFAHRQFTRNPDKYVRYHPDALEQIFSHLFE